MNLSTKQTLKLQGCITLPSSKSESIRAMLLASLAKGESTLLNVLSAEDTQAAIQACKALGVSIYQNKHQVSIKSAGLPFSPCHSEINTGNSGITTTFVLPLLGLRSNDATPITLDCGEQMRLRPIAPLIKALRELGMCITHKIQEDKLPILVSGRLIGGRVEIAGMNSQYVSALLISLPCAQQDSIITVKQLYERPYVEMTLFYLKQQGIDYEHKYNNNIDTFYIKGNQQYQPMQATMKGDYSSAACVIAAATLIAGEVTLQGLDRHDHQGDKVLIDILKKMGADIQVTNQGIHIVGKKPLHGICIDASNIPDLVPSLAVIATQAIGKTEINNVSHARIKETDRLHSMTEGLKAMGAKIEEHADGLMIEKSDLKGAVVNGYHDHRTVMGLTVAGLIAEGETLISDGEAINKTYPDFITTMQAIGANINIEYELSKQHIILIGFKYVGKSIIGRQLATLLNKNFIDLDVALEKYYQENFCKSLTCREIMENHGEVVYRNLESIVLQRVLTAPPSIISLGGGATSHPANQYFIKSHTLLHIIAPRGIVFERIMIEGCPAFFDKHKEPYESFRYLWNKRQKIYQSLTKYVVNNDKTIGHAVNVAISQLKKIRGEHLCVV